jgi:linoleoyl-CoA desaturase
MQQINQISSTVPESSISLQRKGKVKFIPQQKSLFFATLKKEVDDYFTERKLSKYGNSKLLLKTLVLLGGYLLPFAAMLLWSPGWIISMALWTIMGIGMAGLGMSVMHDANHGAYSDNKFINWCMAHILNIMGGSTINWKLQHNILHHTYTNITHMDDDIASKPALRLSPHTSHYAAHRYQWWHAFLLYGLTTLYWVTAKDFVQFFKYKREKVNTGTPSENRWIFTKIVLVKLAYYAVFLFVPIAVVQLPVMQVICGFVLMHFLAGLILTVVFQLAHSLEGTHHPLPDSNGIVANDWAIHQMNTTMNFSPNNKWLSWYVGGLNFQVEHHLFPRISHIHYPAIAPIVQRTAEQFGISYLMHEHFTTAFYAHVRFLKELGRPPDWAEAIG